MAQLKDKMAWSAAAVVWLGLGACGAPALADLVADEPGANGVYHMESIISGNHVVDDDSANLGRDNDLLLSGGVTLTTGYDGNALSFDGSSGFGQSTDAIAPQTMEFIKFDVTFKVGSLDAGLNSQHLLTLGVPLRLMIYSDNKKVYFYGANDLKLKSSSLLNTTDWFNVSGIIHGDGTASMTLLDLDTSTSITVETGPSQGVYSLGGSDMWTDAWRIQVGGYDVTNDGTPEDGLYFNGLIDDVKVVTSSTALQTPGDANHDGMVNLADLQILGDNWQSTTATWEEADFTGDGNVNLADLQIIGDNWGFGTSPDVSFDAALGSVIIPEPTGLALLAPGVLLGLRRRVSR